MKPVRVHVVSVQTVQPPRTYSDQQLKTALRIAHTINRGRFILTEPPRR